MTKLKIGLVLLLLMLSTVTFGEVAATHIYHNHMPNFWPYFDVESYDSIADGQPVRYTYDGQVINLKNSPPSNYTFMLPNAGGAMPHDDLVSYYSHHAKTGAYLSWPMDTAKNNAGSHPLSQTHVTMSASVINNVNSFAELGNVDGYGDKNWGEYWKTVHYGTKTSNGYPALDLIHFTGHHSMGPLVGNDYFLKDLIYHNVTVSQDYFLGDGFKSSKGFFPTELGFSERLIPVLNKIGVEWSVLGNVHYSRALTDYPYLNDIGIDCLISPPNRADMQNVDTYGGEWVKKAMFNEKQNTYNKFPFASIPHWVEYIDPETGESHKVAGIPVEQASSWEEGYQGSVSGGFLKDYEGQAGSREQYFVVAHDGDNSSGRAGDGGTWASSGNNTYSESGITGMGVDEYLAANPIPANDIMHVQDGSWIDTRDSSSDPTWNHWRLPMCIWKGQFADFNTATGLNLQPKTSLSGAVDGMTVSFEYGYHYLERNFALLQAAENYAKTAEQIYLDENPNYWSPSKALDYELVGKKNTENQLNPYLMSYPIKGQSNAAELAWYFLVASIDSGFGYYDENIDDGVKPTISFNQSLYFSEPYVEANLSKDKTGPSVWWPQRWPYNPGSANAGKSEGWTEHYFDNNFGIYTYAYDVNGIKNIEIKIRRHTNKVADPKDRTYQVYDPETLAAQGIPNINPDNVEEWVTYSMIERELEINGVDWQPTGKEMMDIVPAQKIGNLYYNYIGDYRDELLDYYIEATDSKGNVTRSDIQQVYVGAGRYTKGGTGYIEDVNGDIEGTYPFLVAATPSNKVTVYIEADNIDTFEYKTMNGDWTEKSISKDYTGFYKKSITYDIDSDGLMVRFDNKPSQDGEKITTGTWTIYADGTVKQEKPQGVGFKTTIYYKTDAMNIHWSVVDESGAIVETKWTTPPGEAMDKSEFDGYLFKELDLESYGKATVCFNINGEWDTGGSSYPVDAGVWTYEGSGKFVEGAPGEVEEQNKKPVAKTCIDKSFDEGMTVDLDGNDSKDTDGQIVSYNWRQTSGITVELSSSSKVAINFEAPEVTETSKLIFELTVTDNKGATDKDTVTVTIKDTDSDVIEITSVSLTNDQKEVKVGESFELPKTATVKMSDGTEKSVDVTWNDSADTSIEGTYRFEGTVNDYNGKLNYELIVILDSTEPTIESIELEYDSYQIILGGSAKFPKIVVTYSDDTSKKVDGDWDKELDVNKIGTTNYTSKLTNVSKELSSVKVFTLKVEKEDEEITTVDLKYYTSTVQVNESFTLPNATVKMADGTSKEVTVNWDNDVDTSKEGTYNFSGKVNGFDDTFNFKLVVKKGSIVSDNGLTIYYKTSSKKYIHYSAGAEWTTLPGLKMNDSEIDGYTKIVLNVELGSKLQVTFNDGAGNWDNNNKWNYRLVYTDYTSVYTIEDGKTLSAEPGDTSSKQVTVYYKSSFSTAYMHYNTGNGWTKLPGEKMEESDMTGYVEKVIEVNPSKETQLTFNDSYGHWDSLAERNYRFSGSPKYVIVENGKLEIGKPEENISRKIKVYYEKNLGSEHYMLYSVLDQTKWNTEPGVKMDDYSANDDYVFTEITVNSNYAEIEATFNDGAGNWDNNYQANYNISVVKNQDNYTVSDNNVTAGKPTGGIDDSDKEAPVITKVNPEEGTFKDNVNVKVSVRDNEDANPKVYYTLDGTNPTNNSSRYTSSGIEINETSVLKLLAVDNSGNATTINEYVYNYEIETVVGDKPMVSSNIIGGTYDLPMNVKLYVKNASTGKYTLDGSNPEMNGTEYSDEDIIKITEETTLRLYAVNSNDDVSATYEYKAKTTDKPVVGISPNGKDFKTATIKVILSVSGEELTVKKYTLNGSNPKTSATAKNFIDGEVLEIGEGLANDEAITVKVYAENNGGEDSATETFTKINEDIEIVITSIKLEKTKETVEEGDYVVLPKTVTATDSLGNTSEIEVTWDKTINTNKAGTYTFIGTVEGYTGTVEFKLNVISGDDDTDVEDLGKGYKTNPNGQVGKNKTITIDGSNTGNEWTDDMIIAIDLAGDDSRTLGEYWGAHEYPVIDFTNLYAAWDDENLYIGAQLVDPTDIISPGQYTESILTNDGILLWLAFDTISGEGSSEDMWGKGNSWTGKYLPDYQLYFAGNCNGNTRFISKAVDGTFGGDKELGDTYLHFRDAGIDVVGEAGLITSDFIGVPTANDRFDEDKMFDYLVKGENQYGDSVLHDPSNGKDSFYEIMIPLSSIGMTKNQLENQGFGVMMGCAGRMDSIPHDETTLDSPGATEDGQIYENGDMDEFTVPFAKIGGKVDTGDDNVTVTIKDVELISTIGTVDQYKNFVLPGANVTYSDESTKVKAVNWDQDLDTSEAGIFELTGKVSGSNKELTFKLTVREDTTPVTISKVELTSTSKKITQGDSFELPKANVTYSNGNKMTKTVNWNETLVIDKIGKETYTGKIDGSDKLLSFELTVEEKGTDPVDPVNSEFTWDNATLYFVMNDRFYNGNTSNDESYGRVKTDATGKNIGTFHGGDLAGLTEKIEYLKNIGVTAIWFTAAYEQMHGWCSGGESGDFAHYAYHGYYAIDWSSLDKNMGTVAEMKKFVDTAHENGIRVVMDIVMNHTGYPNLKDMDEYGYGATGKADWTPNDGNWSGLHSFIPYDDANSWTNWWGSWARAGIPGSATPGSDDMTKTLADLPDLVTEATNPMYSKFFEVKWGKESSGYSDWIVADSVRSKGPNQVPAEYVIDSLAAWVEEFGIDGFRGDTAKHLDLYRWKQLKDASKQALKKWRSNNPTSAGADWDEEFWMTGEHWNFNAGGGGHSQGDYYSNGFDNMIDFGFKGSVPLDSGSMGSKWSEYASKGGKLLPYISSHDTGSVFYNGDEGRQIKAGTGLLLTPGPVQIYYGDEIGRDNGDGGSDADQGSRSDFQWNKEGNNINKHWAKIGMFRANNPAVGAGQQKEIESNTFGRSWNNNKVVIKLADGSQDVNVSGFFSDGDKVRNAYNGETGIVSGGKVKFTGENGVILVELNSGNSNNDNDNNDNDTDDNDNDNDDTDKSFNGIKIYADYSYVYAWTGSGESAVALSGAWPGSKMNSGYYEFSGASTVNLVLNNGLNADQTDDLTISGKGIWKYENGSFTKIGDSDDNNDNTDDNNNDNDDTDDGNDANDTVKLGDRLGATYSPESTTFAIWSPDTSDVKIEVEGKSYNCEKVQDFEGYNNVYGVTINGDLHLKEYQFKIKGVDVRDPYGVMVKYGSGEKHESTENGAKITSDVGLNTNIVIDLNKTEPKNGWSNRPKLENREDSVIYEVHVHDFTISENSGVSDKNRGKYMGMVETGTKNGNISTGIDHLKELGVTHVQLMPVYDFSNKFNHSTGEYYNWGYDPVNFNIPEDRYASDPEDYAGRIKEFKTMIDDFHKEGIRVIIDVVYNHTYWNEMFDDITPGYYKHYSRTYGELTDSIDSYGQKANMSGCGNGIDTGNPMVSRFIRDSLEYWVNEFNVDGFRFDLLGIYHTDEVKSWGTYLNQKYSDRNLLLYGEPWDGYWEAGILYNDDFSQDLKNEVGNEASQRARMGNIGSGASEHHVGVFNGKYREDIKGNNDGDVKGYMFNTGNSLDIELGIKGAIGGSGNDAWKRDFTEDPEQSINYISAHDNLCLWDKIKYCGENNDYGKKVLKFGMGMVLTSQGIPFMHAGDEFLRTKPGENGHNSYMWGTETNKIDWELKSSNSDVNKYHVELLKLRKDNPGLRLTTKQDILSYVKTYRANGNVVVMESDNDKNGEKDIVVVFNPGNDIQVNLPSGNWKKVFDINGKVNKTDVTAEGTAVTVFVKQ